MVAWIGSQAVSLPAAVEEAARLLASSRCPVFSIDSDIHGCRSLIALAERAGAAYDHVRGRDLADGVSLYTELGGFFTTATEARRRSDLIAVVGDIPAVHDELLRSLASAVPDLAAGGSRRWFHLALGKGGNRFAHGAKAVSVASGDLPLGGMLAVLRARISGKSVSTTLTNMDRFCDALAKAAFPVFIFSRLEDAGSLVMLQGIIADINKTRRATSLFLPPDDDSWGLVLASTWMTGLPPRTCFSTGKPVYDPLLFDVERMMDEKEADMHLWVSEKEIAPPRKRRNLPLVAMARTERPVDGAAVTFAIGKAGTDRDGVAYTSRTGTLAAVKASAPSDLPGVQAVVARLAEALPRREEALPC
ncbi:MAG: tungsten formylmethanofuran dehydrogenase [Shinella sp.]|nr:tungsten formylmethanofuran dehydrogenase [Shinella sp.]